LNTCTKISLKAPEKGESYFYSFNQLREFVEIKMLLRLTFFALIFIPKASILELRVQKILQISDPDEIVPSAL
jgi:hypothetical protein